MFGIGTTELLIVLAIVLLLFGTTRLPKLGEGLGSAIRSFKRGLSGDADKKDDSSDKKES